MGEQHRQYASNLAGWLVRQEDGFVLQCGNPECVTVADANGDSVTLNLAPFAASPQPVSAKTYFAGVATMTDLLAAYHEARHRITLETDLPQLHGQLHPHADEFLETLLARGRETITETEVRSIASWVENFDLYVAVKCVESLLNSRADRALLGLAAERGWNVLFDHLAIRCGSAENHAGEQVAALLCEQHGYTPAGIEGEAQYRFADGWNAFPLYKMLENGQVLRLFLDESDGTNPAQIIQHWNRVYGFTAHHLALRVTRQVNGRHQAVALETLAEALAAQGIGIMTPTGGYTRGLLVQVFTRPEWNPAIPADIKRQLRAIAPALELAIENGKLLELLSRTEAPPALAPDYFALYGLDYEPANPLHSVPVYQYFLPAQAAHVIRTSVDNRHKECSQTGEV